MQTSPGRFPHAQEIQSPLQGERLDLAWILSDLAQRGVNELHIEAGATLNAAFLQADLVDEILLYLAPKLLGPGRPLAGLLPLDTVAQAKAFEFIDVSQIGDDLRLRAWVPGRERF